MNNVTKIGNVICFKKCLENKGSAPINERKGDWIVC